MPAFAPSKITATEYTYVLDQNGQRRLVRKESSMEKLTEEMVFLLQQIRFGLSVMIGTDISSIDT